MKVALVKPGTPFEIVTNIHSKRKTETIVAFDGEERLYGADAANIGVRRPASAYSQIRKLLGSSVENPEVTALTELQYYPYTFLNNATRGNLQVAHEQKEDGQAFHAEELVAMVFSHARDITKEFSGGYVDDWVITVPVYFTQPQRQAILDAAELTKIRVLSLVNENTAAALQFSIDRIYDEPTRVLFYNLGSTSLQVSVVEYSSMVVPDGFKKNKTVGTFSVLGHAWDTQVGGSAFDLRLAEYLADQVNDQFQLSSRNLDIRQIPRPFAKLRSLAKKTKIVLSANENIPVVMQSLYDDRDFKTTVSRSKFEELSADLFQRCLEPVRTLLSELALTPSDLNMVEIIGGSVRIPKVKSMLKQYFDQDLGVHLNGDEAMALGAAFRAANLSTAFRVRSIGMNDIQTYDIGLRLSDKNDWVKKASLFKRNSKLGAKKIVSFSHEQDFDAVFRYDDASSGLLPEGTRRVIGHYQISGLTEFVAEMKERNLGTPKVTLSFVLSASGTVSIAHVEAMLEEQPVPLEETEEEKDFKEDESTKTSESEDKSDEEKNETKSDDKSDEEKDKTSSDDKSDEEMDKTTSDDKSDVEKDKTTSDEKIDGVNNEAKSENTQKTNKAAPRKPIQHRRVLTYRLKTEERAEDVSILPMSILDKEESRSMLKEMQARDDLRRQTAMAKNELESFVYSARDSIASKKSECLEAKVITESDLDALSTEVNDTEEWLYDEGENAELKDYQNRLRTMKKTLESMIYRLEEVSNRPAAVKRVQSYNNTVHELVDEWPSSKPHLTQDDFAEVLKRMATLMSWTQDRMADQEKLELHDDPAFASSEILRKLKTLKRFVNSVKDRKPPPPPPAPKPSNETVADNNSTTETNNSTTESGTTSEDNPSQGTTDEPKEAQKEEL